jgi:hypothetical protein
MNEFQMVLILATSQFAAALLGTAMNKRLNDYRLQKVEAKLDNGLYSEIKGVRAAVERTNNRIDGTNTRLTRIETVIELAKDRDTPVYRRKQNKPPPQGRDRRNSEEDGR